MGRSGFVDPNSRRGGRGKKNIQVTDTPKLHPNYVFQFLSPGSSPSNHKEPKAGNRRAGKDADIVSRSREQNQQKGSHCWDFRKPHWLVLHPTCAGFWTCSLNQHIQKSKSTRAARAGVALWTERWHVPFPVRARAWVVGQVPSWGMCERQPIDVSLVHQCFSPSLSPSSTL